MNALRYIGSLVLLVLVLGTSLAMAEQETAVPKTPAAAPTAPARVQYALDLLRGSRLLDREVRKAEGNKESHEQ
jgi:hypothetical protein